VWGDLTLMMDDVLTWRVRQPFLQAKCSPCAFFRPFPPKNTDKPPALAAPTLQSINFTECDGRYNPRPQCTPGRVLASPKFTAGALELLSGDGSKAHGTPNGVDIRILVAPGAAAPAAQGGAPTECIAPLPKLKVGAGGAAPRVALRCPGCKRCLRKLGLSKGDSFMAAVRARKAGKFPASEWSSAVPASL
jgi:hypothetical protein